MGKFNENRERIITQDKFIRRLAGNEGISNAEAEKWLKAVKKELTACLMDGLAVKLVELGTIEPRQRVARKNPHNAIVGGKETMTKAMTVAHLIPSSKLNERLTLASENRNGVNQNGE